MCPSRKRTTSIMNHGGFGEVVEIINGIPVVIPQSFIFKDGKYKVYAQTLISKLKNNKIGIKEFYSYAK